MVRRKYLELRSNYAAWLVFFILLKSINRKIINKFATLYWKFAGVEIGKGSIIQYGVKINCPKKVVIGNNCLVTKGAMIVSEQYDKGQLILEDNVQINSKVHLDITGELLIRKNSLISEGVFIYTHDHGYDPRSLPKLSNLTIGEKVWIGAHSTVLPYVSVIESNSIVGTGSMVTKKINKNSLVVGVPGKTIKLICD